MKENTLMANLPDLHDGFFDGVWLSDNKSACLFVRTVKGDRSTIRVSEVAALHLRNLRQGNIIFDLTLVETSGLTLEHVTGAYDSEDHDLAERMLQRARQQGLRAMELSTSYGAEGIVLFRTLEVIPMHVLQ